jgi:hypothetical protein
LGAAFVWAAMNISYMSVGVWLTHRRLLIGETRTWYFNVMFPLLGILFIVLTGRQIFNYYGSQTTVGMTLLISGVFLFSVLAAVLLSQAMRVTLVHKLRVLLAAQS